MSKRSSKQNVQQKRRPRRRFQCQCRDDRDERFRHCGCLQCRRRRFERRNWDIKH